MESDDRSGTFEMPPGTMQDFPFNPQRAHNMVTRAIYETHSYSLGFAYSSIMQKDIYWGNREQTRLPFPPGQQLRDIAHGYS